MPIGFAGDVVHTSGQEIVSRITEGAVPSGAVVKRGTNSLQVIKSGATPFGIACRSVANETTSDIPDKAEVSIMRKGYMLLDVKNTGSQGAAMYAVNTSGEVYVGTASTGQTDIPVTLDETITAAGIARCRVQF
jgi:hypothetical protein